MPSKKFPTIWEASPHTLAKISILRSYLHAYFQILGRTSRGANILYIDGFAGPGEYVNDPCGSPVAAVEAAVKSVRDMGHSWEAKAVYLAFIEADKKRAEHLATVLEKFELQPEVKSGAVQFRIFEGSFVDQITLVRKWCPSPFTSREPLFAFIDPFGATGAPFRLVRELLKSPCSEIFLNLDADGITRLLKAQKIPANSEHLDAIFDASDITDSWRDFLDDGKDYKALFDDVLNLYKKRLEEEAGAKYVFSFEMCNSATTHNYHLVFATGHPRGIEKMKEAMKVLDQDGSYRFLDTDAVTGQTILFRFDDPAIHARIFFEVFKGQTVQYPKLRDWTLTKSPFITPGRMLANLQTDGLIEVTPLTGEKIRRGDFPEKKIASILFAPARNQPFRSKK